MRNTIIYSYDYPHRKILDTEKLLELIQLLADLPGKIKIYKNQ